MAPLAFPHKRILRASPSLKVIVDALGEGFGDAFGGLQVGDGGAGDGFGGAEAVEERLLAGAAAVGTVRNGVS